MVGFRIALLLHKIIIYYINDFLMKQNTTSRFAGPPLFAVALVHVLLFVASLVSAALLRHGAPFVTPYADAEAVRAFFADNALAVKVSAFFFLGSAVPLGIFTATVVSRLLYLGVRAAGTHIALFGGFGATGLLVLSSLSTWVLSLPDVSASPIATRALYFFSFLFGGAAFAVMFGLLAAGISITSYLSRLLPRWLFVLGMIVAVAGELSALSLIAFPATFFIPITRFGGFLWLILVGLRLPKDRTSDGVVAAR
jgi:hypothetical protein